MSDCNKCRLSEIKVADNETLTTEPTPDMPGENSFNVYVHPKNLRFMKDSKFFNDKYFVAWFMDIGDTCECD